MPKPSYEVHSGGSTATEDLNSECSLQLGQKETALVPGEPVNPHAEPLARMSGWSYRSNNVDEHLRKTGPSPRYHLFEAPSGSSPRGTDDGEHRNNLARAVSPRSEKKLTSLFLFFS